MKIFSIPAGLALFLLCVGCDSFQSNDAIFNATTNSLTINASFQSGTNSTYEQAPETFVAYMRKERHEQLPQLTKISISSNQSGVTNILTHEQILKLRHLSNGKLYLVYFDEGLAVIPKSFKKELSRMNNLHDFAEFFRSRKSDFLIPTKRILENVEP